MPLPPRKRDRRNIRFLFFAVAFVALAISVWQVVSLTHLLRRAQHATGHVVARVGDRGASESGAHPDIEFQDRNGRTVRYNQNGMGSRRVGTAISILYDQADPAGTAVADSFWQLWLYVLLPFFMATGFGWGALWGDVYSNLDPYLAAGPRS